VIWWWLPALPRRTQCRVLGVVAAAGLLEQQPCVRDFLIATRLARLRHVHVRVHVHCNHPPHVRHRRHVHLPTVSLCESQLGMYMAAELLAVGLCAQPTPVPWTGWLCPWTSQLTVTR